MKKVIVNKFILILFLILNSCSIENVKNHKNVNRTISSDSGRIKITIEENLKHKGKPNRIHELNISLDEGCCFLRKRAPISFHILAKENKKIKFDFMWLNIGNTPKESLGFSAYFGNQEKFSFQIVGRFIKPIIEKNLNFHDGFINFTEEIPSQYHSNVTLKVGEITFKDCEDIGENGPLPKKCDEGPVKLASGTLSFETGGNGDEDDTPIKKCDGKPGTNHINILEDGTKEMGGFVADTAFVGEDVFLDKNSSVCGYATVEDYATITGETEVTGNATISRHAKIKGEGAYVYGYATVTESAQIEGNAYIGGNALVRGHANIQGNVKVIKNAIISGSAKIKGDVYVDGYATVSGYARVEGNKILIDENARVSGYSRIMEKAKIQGVATISGSVIVNSKSVVRGNFKASGKQEVEGVVDENSDSSETSTEIEEDRDDKILPRDTSPVVSKGLSCRPSDAHSINYQNKSDEIIDELKNSQYDYEFTQIKFEGKSVDFNKQNLNKKSTCGEALYSGSHKAKKQCDSKGGIVPYSSEIVELDCTCEKSRLELLGHTDDDFWCTARGFLKCKGGRDISGEDQTKFYVVKEMANQVISSFDFQNIAELSIKTFAQKNNLRVPEMPNTQLITYFMGIRNLYQQAKNIKGWIEEQTGLGKTNDVVMLQLDKMRDELEGQKKCLEILREEMPETAYYLPKVPYLRN